MHLLGELAALSAPVLLAVAGTVAYNYVRFGTTLGFPLEPFETFSTPLLVGLAGLLFSPGKGIFWYFPALWLGVAFIPHWRRSGRLPDFLLAAASALALIVLYALWYDWPGGRAWGPRMIITAIPALAVLVLPAVDWLVRRVPLSPSHPLTPSPRHPFTRSFIAALLLLSFAVQLPGVLVNFERQEELDMQAGVTFDQLLWSPAHSPLLTYWGRITTTPDPLGLQPYVRDLAGIERGMALAAASLALLAAVGLRLGARDLWSKQRTRLWLGITAGVLLLLALLLPILARDDPRWDEQSAVREDNYSLRTTVAAASQQGDLVLLDLLPSSDKGRRTGQWLNFADQPYIGWLRKGQMDGAAGERLAAWLTPYRRVWLLLQATDEGDRASTTEAWLNAHAFAGRRWWQGGQRAVEYLLPAAAAEDQAETQTVEATGPFDFGAAVLDSYRLTEDALGGVRLLLRWESVGDAEVRYSVQAIGPSGVLAQVDGRPGAANSAGLAEDRIGLSLPAEADQLILKLYHAGDGSVFPVTAPGKPAAEALSLQQP